MKEMDFAIIHIQYTQPSIATGRKPIPLRIMTYQRTVTEAEYQENKKSAVPTCISCIGAADEVLEIF